MVLATQNPLEQEGIYPLPEAQMDRFMFKILVDYPNKAEELEIMNRMGTENTPQVNAVISEENLLRSREMTDKVYVDENVKIYIVDIVAATRKLTGIQSSLSWIPLFKNSLFRPNQTWSHKFSIKTPFK